MRRLSWLFAQVAAQSGTIHALHWAQWRTTAAGHGCCQWCLVQLVRLLRL
jgi:hypothetical protein